LQPLASGGCLCGGARIALYALASTSLTRNRRGHYWRHSPDKLEHVQSDKEVFLFWAHRLGDLKVVPCRIEMKIAR
jgi:hypothetical protein